MIDWYVEILDGSPENFKSDDYLSKVITTAKPCMDYFCKRLTEVEDFTLEDMMKIFSEIIEVHFGQYHPIAVTGIGLPQF